jgi:hypothetical protein
MSVTEVQVQLSTNEAIVLLFDTPEWKPTPEETFIWVVTKSNVRWVFAIRFFEGRSCALPCVPSTCRSIPDRCDRHSPALQEVISASGALN